MSKKLDFFIVGAQKAATTALFTKLTKHPDIFSQDRKELHFFDKERKIDWNAPDYTELHTPFKAAPNDKLIGEATPIYMFWPNAIERLANYNPSAKIIVSLRHPAYRALSHWKMEVTRGHETLSFADAVSDVGRNRLLDGKRINQRRFTYVERGIYADQIQTVLKCFPRDQVAFLTSDQLFTDETAVLRDLWDLLGVDHALAAHTNEQEVVLPIDSRSIAFDDWDALRALTQEFVTDIASTAELTGLDLDAWMQPGFAEPQLGGIAKRSAKTVKV